MARQFVKPKTAAKGALLIRRVRLLRAATASQATQPIGTA